MKSKLSRGKKLLCPGVTSKTIRVQRSKSQCPGGKIIEKSCPGDKRRKLSSIGGVQL